MAVRVPIGAWNGPQPEGHVSPGGHASQIDEILDDGAFLQAFCERILGDAVAAEDIVQETYLYAVKNLDRLERRGSYAPWLATVARRRSANEVRRRVRLEPVDQVPDVPSTFEGDPADAVATQDTLERVRAAFDDLSPRERLLLERQVFDELSIAELAAIDNSSASSVKSVLNRARAKIRAAVEEVHVRVIAPVAGLAAAMRRQLASAGLKIQQAGPALPGGVDRAGEAITVAVAALVLGGSVGASTVSPDAPPDLDSSSASPVASHGVTGDDALSAITGHRSPVQVAPAPAAEAGPRPASPTVEGDTPPRGDDRSGVVTPLPSPAGPRPVDPDEPVPKDDASEPDDASFADFASPVTPHSGSGGQTDGGGGAPAHVFAIGELTRRCTTECSVLFHSSDGGSTWERVAAEGMGAATQILVAPGYPEDRRLYVMGPTGLRLSLDGGATFAPVDEPYQGVAAMSPAFSDGDERILIGAPPSWAYDAGADETMPLAATPLAGLRNYFAFPPDHAETGLMLAGSLVQGAGGVKTPAVFHCRSTVCEERVELPWGRDVPSLAVSSTFADDGLVFAWIGGILYRSSDAGRSFEYVDLGISGTVESVTDDGAGTQFVAWRGRDSDGPTGGLLRSQDGGRTWHRLDDDSLAGGVAALRVVGDHILAARTREAGGGVWCSSDGGSTWATRCPPPLI